MSKLNKFLFWCAGANPSLLKKCPTEHAKYSGIGATVVFTGIFAALSAGYALSTIFEYAIVGIGFGLIWGLMIFNLDRFIVSSIKKESNVKRELLQALPRIILAIFLSIVIAKPLELKIFEKEINVELQKIQTELLQENTQLITQRSDSTIANYENKINKIRSDEAVLLEKKELLSMRAQQEADGTGGSGKKNLGPIYRLKKQDADQAQQEYQSFLDKNIVTIANYQKRIEELEREKLSQIDAIDTKNFNGFAARLQAFERLTGTNSALFFANIFILLLFIAIETAPIFVKLMSNRGPYDDLLQSHEHEFVAHRSWKLAYTNKKTKKKGTKLSDIEKDYLHGELNNALE